MVAVDRDRRIVEFNPAAEQAFGYPRDDVLGKHVNLLYADPVAGDAARRTILERDGAVIEVVNRRKSGELFTSLLSAALLRDSEGKVLGVVGASCGRDRAQGGRRHSAHGARRPRPDDRECAGRARGGEGARHRTRHRRFAEMLGYARRNLSGQSTERVIYPAGRNTRSWPRRLPGTCQGSRYETSLQLKRKDGTLFWAHLAAGPWARRKRREVDLGGR